MEMLFAIVDGPWQAIPVTLFCTVLPRTVACPQLMPEAPVALLLLAVFPEIVATEASMPLNPLLLASLSAIVDGRVADVAWMPSPWFPLACARRTIPFTM